MDLRAMFARRLRLAEAGRHARIVQALPLGPGSRLLVVEFGGQRLLVGQARTGLVRLGLERVGLERVGGIGGE